MSTSDVCILTPILLATIAALIVIRLTFRNAATARDALITPAVFAVCGALIGISIGMIWLADREGRVTIEKGVLVLGCGASLGALAGVGAKKVYPRLKWGKAAGFVLVTMVLGGSIGAPIGWLAGNMGARKVYEIEELSTSRMMWGIAIGSGVGFLLGLSEVLFRRRGAT
jgi:hypothetical protein